MNKTAAFKALEKKLPKAWGFHVTSSAYSNARDTLSRDASSHGEDEEFYGLALGSITSGYAWNEGVDSVKVSTIRKHVSKIVNL